MISKRFIYIGVCLISFNVVAMNSKLQKPMTESQEQMQMMEAGLLRRKPLVHPEPHAHVRMEMSETMRPVQTSRCCKPSLKCCCRATLACCGYGTLIGCTYLMYRTMLIGIRELALDYAK